MSVVFDFLVISIGYGYNYNDPRNILSLELILHTINLQHYGNTVHSALGQCGNLRFFISLRYCSHLDR